ncbi:hypothetical protein HDE_02384 [Halotydeus destructor]|nr:hypothetical protein HDE_02384 [Halotydeus destructor]
MVSTRLLQVLVNVSFVVYFVSDIIPVICVDIKRVSLPTHYDTTSGQDLILDCDYGYNENDLKLVVRWYYNNTPEPIYQWIPEKDIRTVSEDIRDHFDFQHTTNPNDPYTKFRSMRIVNPEPYLSGRYVCDISSLASQDSRDTSLLIYASPRVFDFNYVVNKESGRLELECKALRAYPQPLVMLSKLDSNNQLQPVENAPTTTHIGGRYDSVIKYSMPFKKSSNTQIHKFECSVDMPEVSFKRRKRISIHPQSSANWYESVTSMAQCEECSLDLNVLLITLIFGVMATF